MNTLYFKEVELEEVNSYTDVCWICDWIWYWSRSCTNLI